MSETQQVAKKTSTGTAWIIWGALSIALALIHLVTTPLVIATSDGDGATVAGKIAGVLLFGGLGVWLLVIGLNKRRRYLTR